MNIDSVRDSNYTEIWLSTLNIGIITDCLQKSAEGYIFTRRLRVNTYTASFSINGGFNPFYSPPIHHDDKCVISN